MPNLIIPDFPLLEIPGLTDTQTKSGRADNTLSVRSKPHHLRYPPAINWTSIWPSAATFNHSVVPFPIRQGYCKNLAENHGVSPGKFGNAELMKIPNFLHLTKAHIKMHCEALKKFCTTWPRGLNGPQEIEKHYPLEVVRRSYLFSAPNLRDPRARIVTIKVPLAPLGLDDRAKRKLLRLAIGSSAGRKVARYNYGTDVLQLTSGRCPTASQNEQYLKYVLSVLVLESKKLEKWEQDPVDRDWFVFDWNRSHSRQVLLSALNKSHTNTEEVQSATATTEIESTPKVMEYQKALEAVWSENDLLRRYQWPCRRFGQYKLRPAYPPIRNVPFQPIPAADKPSILGQYAMATRALFGLAKSPPT
ncbi:28S ribosomal protein S35 mitochondrial [Fasciola hepatica]|uniref:28S ribosomal protein S35 mitochondrial n=1 Tax=Fasciola hepatica TaxID=6192 RepID=A0A4E0RRM9_FASHE|nr:28S ribosomal protein S35 mitochondrial [Fasciola hepatica]